MARIIEADVNLVRERARIDEIVRDYVNLKSAGGGSLKGLCPFHDERTPSFHVNTARGFFHCFGCGESGDVFTFLKKVDGLAFVDAVEKLAARFNIPLHYEEGSVVPDRQAGQRSRLVAAHKAAADFYVQQLATPAAQSARDFLTGRGFGPEAAAHFGIGFAPKGWDSLLNYLRAQGFRDDELLAGGLLSQGQRGVYDRFRGRLLWPIRDLGGDVVGFGARRLFDDDDGPKYLNTPETPLYKKSQVLYGVDLARRDIAKRQQAVIVEGYTDVMACHLAGITTAVATCGTAFGSEHIKILRRLLMDSDVQTGEVIFTFDGDAAGQKAALKAFTEDQKFVSRTFVAVEPSGLDPCDLWQQRGPEAVAALVSRKQPLFEFAIRTTLANLDLNTAEGRVAGLRMAAPVVAQIRDAALRPEYTRLLAGWLGMDLRAVSDAVNSATRRKPEPTSASQAVPTEVAPRRATLPSPDPRRVEHRVEREALKAVVQTPSLVVDWYAVVDPTAYTHEPYRVVHEAIAGVLTSTDPLSFDALGWTDAIRASVIEPYDQLLGQLIVEPIAAEGEAVEAYVVGVIARLLELDAARQIEDLKGRLQRMDVVADPDGHAALFESLLRLEAERRRLHDLVRGVS